MPIPDKNYKQKLVCRNLVPICVAILPRLGDLKMQSGRNFEIPSLSLDSAQNPEKTHGGGQGFCGIKLVFLPLKTKRLVVRVLGWDDN